MENSSILLIFYSLEVSLVYNNYSDQRFHSRHGYYYLSTYNTDNYGGPRFVTYQYGSPRYKTV